MTDRDSSRSSAEPSPPARPSRRVETLANRLFLALSPRLESQEQSSIPPTLGPSCDFYIERSERSGRLAARLFPVHRPRGSVLLVHPWRPWGKAYFHTRGRIQALRRAGYHVLCFDLSGFGGSSPVRGFFDRDVVDALAWLRDYSAGVPLHLWGVSAGGYWSHPALSRFAGVSGAMFEDVSPHLLEWSHRMAPRGWPFYKFFEHILKSAYRYLDARSHAPFLGVEAVTYVSGGDDHGIHPSETRQLAELAGGSSTIIEGASHLGSIRRAGGEVTALALETFAEAERRAERNTRWAADDRRRESRAGQQRADSRSAGHWPVSRDSMMTGLTG